jgi:ubiquinone/menaquinone biosynthesis C-methylase UbiE
MTNEIKLLDALLLKDEKKLRELTRWLRVMNRPNGWHYDLDHIWILNQLEMSGIKPGSVIIDAGAGQGIMQYLLASRGYKVISLDFSPRNPPARSRGIFEVKGEGAAAIDYQHSYMKFINYGTSQLGGWTKQLSLQKIRKLPELPGRFFRKSLSYFWYLNERFLGDHSNYCEIKFVRAPFHDIPLESEVADAVISVSAIEHADIELFDSNIKSLLRLLKPGAPMLLTTSATTEDKNTYDQKVSGWCFSRSALGAFFPDCKIDFNTESCISSLLNSQTFMSRLDPYYYQDSMSPFYKKKFTSFPYLPVSVKVIK